MPPPISEMVRVGNLYALPQNNRDIQRLTIGPISGPNLAQLRITAAYGRCAATQAALILHPARTEPAFNPVGSQLRARPKLHGCVRRERD